MIVMMTQNWGRSKKFTLMMIFLHTKTMKYRVSVLTGLIHPYQFYSCLPSSWQHFKNHSLLCVWGQLLSFLFEPFPSHVPGKRAFCPSLFVSRYLSPQQRNIHSWCCVMLLRSWDFLGLGHLAPVCCTGHWGDLQLAHRQGGVAMVSKLLDVRYQL